MVRRRRRGGGAGLGGIGGGAGGVDVVAATAICGGAMGTCVVWEGAVGGEGAVGIC